MSGLYTGSMGMISNMNKLTLVSNNIANSETNGYKADIATFKSFEETFKDIDRNGKHERIGGYKDQVYMDDTYTNFKEGSFQITNQQYDLALHDSAEKNSVSFFVVSKNNEVYLTRNGNFQLDAQRRLSTPNGALVLDDKNNPITIPQGVSFSIKEDGVIVNAGNGKEMGKMNIKSVNKEDLPFVEKTSGGLFKVMTFQDIQENFKDVNSLLKEFDHNETLKKMFGSKEKITNIFNNRKVDILKDFNGQVNQFTLESSNIDMSTEMIALMDAQKGVNASQKVMTTMDGIMEKEANDISK